MIPKFGDFFYFHISYNSKLIEFNFIKHIGLNGMGKGTAVRGMVP